MAQPASGDGTALLDRQGLTSPSYQARAAGLTPAQHQLLLAIRGHVGATAPTISDVAEQLLLRHHSTVELIDRAEREGIVRRSGDPDDARTVRLEITPEGESRLDELSEQHLRELRRLAPRMASLWAGSTESTELVASVSVHAETSIASSTAATLSAVDITVLGSRLIESIPISTRSSAISG